MATSASGPNWVKIARACAEESGGAVEQRHGAGDRRREAESLLWRFGTRDSKRGNTEHDSDSHEHTKRIELRAA